MRRLAILPLALLLSAFAVRADDGPQLGFHLQAGYPVGSLQQDLNGHMGFGSAVSLALPVGNHLQIRPNFEYNGYRVSPYNLVAWAVNVDDKEIFRTYKLGADLLFWARPGCRSGAYFMAGLGAQHSRVDWTMDGSERTTEDTRLSHNGAWFGLGMGYQFDRHLAIEWRYSSSPYATQRSLPLSSLPTTERVVRDGQFITVSLVLRGGIGR